MSEKISSSLSKKYKSKTRHLPLFFFFPSSSFFSSFFTTDNHIRGGKTIEALKMKWKVQIDARTHIHTHTFTIPFSYFWKIEMESASKNTEPQFYSTASRQWPDSSTWWSGAKPPWQPGKSSSPTNAASVVTLLPPLAPKEGLKFSSIITPWLTPCQN